MLAACTFTSLRGQASQATSPERSQTPTATTTPLAFDVVSVKPAPPGAFPIVPAFMRGQGGASPRAAEDGGTGLPDDRYAYHMQMSETL